MSADKIEAEVTVSLDPKKFLKGSEKIEKGLDKVSGKAKQSGDKVDSSFDKMGQSADAAGGDIQQFGDKADRAMDKTVDSSAQAESAMTTMAVSVLGLAQAMAGLTDQVFGLESALVGLAKTAFGVKEAFRDAERAAEDLRIQIALGNISLFEQTRLLQDLAFLNRKAALETESLAAETMAMNGQYVNFALNIATTVIFSFTTLISLKTILKLKTVATTASTVADTAADVTNAGSKATNSAAIVTNTGAKTLNTAGTTLNSTAKGINSTAIGLNSGAATANTGATITNTATTGIAAGVTGFLTSAKVALTGATVAVTAAIWAQVAATRALMLSNPITAAALIATTAAVVVYEGNLLGARDTMEDMVGAERGSFPTLTGAISDLIPVTEEVNEDFKNTEFRMAEMQQTAIMMNLTLEETIEIMTRFKNADGSFNFELALSVQRAAEAGEEIEALGTTLTGVATKFGSTSSAIFRFNEQIAGKGVEDLENRITLLQTALNNTDFDPLSDGFKLAKAGIMLEITDIARGLELISGEKTDEFLASFEKMGILVPDDLAKIEKAIGRINDGLDETKKKLPLFESEARSIVFRLLEQAAVEEAAGNRAGAIFLQRAARTLGGNISGDQSIINAAKNLILTRDAFGNVSTNLNFGQGDDGVFSLAQAGIIQQRPTSPSKGSAVAGIGGFKGRDRNPRGRLDKLGERLRRQWKALTDRQSSFRLASGQLVTLSWREMAKMMGFSLARTGLSGGSVGFARTGANDGRSFAERGEAMRASFTVAAANILSEVGARIANAQFLVDISPEEFDIREALSLAGRGYSSFRAESGTGSRESGATIEIKKIVDEINEGRGILGLQDTDEDLAKIARLEALLPNLSNEAIRDVITSEGEGLSAASIASRIRTRALLETQQRLFGSGSEAFREALDAFRGTEKFDFRNSIRFNIRTGRTGTREKVTTSENFLERLSGFGFLQGFRQETVENPAQLSGIVTGEPNSNAWKREEQLVANMN